MDQTAVNAQEAGQDGSAGIGGVVAGVGGLLGAVGASSCCILPLVLFSLGASGPWLGQLTALAPLQPWLLGATALFLASGFYLVYRRPRGTCAADGSCARPGRRRLLIVALWTATAIAALAAVFPYLAPVLLDV